MIIWVAIAAVFVGVTVGMLGGGGSILTLPLLVYGLHLEPRSAVASSLAVVGLTSLVGAVGHARAGNVETRVAALFGSAGMLGALIGSAIAQHIAPRILLVLFAGVMLVTAVAMMRPRVEPSPAAPVRSRKTPQVLAIGCVVGVLSGLLGAGGGFLIVPALTLVAGLSMRSAIGTSLLVIALQSVAGVAGHLAHGTPIPLGTVSLVSVVAVLGALAGVRMGRRVSTARLRQGFAWFVLAMGGFVLARQVPLRVVVVVMAPATFASLALTAFARRSPPAERPL